MKKITFFLLALLFHFSSQAQLSLGNHYYGEDALKYSQINNPIGTARSFGLSGAMSALGGDAASPYANPAGIAFYNKSEFSMSLDINSGNYNSNYIGNTVNGSSTSTKLGQIAGIFSSPGQGNRKRRSGFALSYNMLKNFNSQYQFQGSNNKSSIQDYFATIANSSGVTVSQLQSEFDKSTWIADTPEAMYYYAYLIEPNDQGGFFVGETGLPVTQTGTIREAGSLGQFDFSYAINLDDKTYLGVGLGIQSLNYSQLIDFSEQFPGGGFIDHFTYRDNLNVTGSGFNFTFGGIFRVSDATNIGFKLTTPTFTAINEVLESSVRNLAINDGSVEYNPTVGLIPNEFQYNQTSPFRGSLGGAFYFPNKLGLFSLEGEFIGYSGMNVRDPYNSTFKTEQKNYIKSTFRNVFNIKSGVEFRIENFRIRGGANYGQDPYKNSNLNRSQFQFTAGAGYRNGRFFTDLGYGYSKNNLAYTPYELSNTNDYGSVLTDRKNNNFKISAGVFF